MSIDKGLVSELLHVVQIGMYDSQGMDIYDSQGMEVYERQGMDVYDRQEILGTEMKTAAFSSCSFTLPR